jgi:hypothetical protein
MGKHDIIDKHYRDARDVLAQLVGAELHEACVRFPPAVEDGAWDNARFERRFRKALPELPPPDAGMMLLLCDFLDLEVDHEVVEIDRKVASGTVQASCPSRAHVETFHFLWQWLLHLLEERAAGMNAPFRRDDKHRAIDSFRRRVVLVAPPGDPLH